MVLVATSTSTNLVALVFSSVRIVLYCVFKRRGDGFNNEDVWYELCDTRSFGGASTKELQSPEEAIVKRVYVHKTSLASS